jgi:hypothetical protein
MFLRRRGQMPESLILFTLPVLTLPLEGHRAVNTLSSCMPNLDKGVCAIRRI